MKDIKHYEKQIDELEASLAQTERMWREEKRRANAYRDLLLNGKQVGRPKQTN